MTCPRDPDAPAPGPLRAAAVCYRRSDEGLQFLLVRTKLGSAWTIPKGHVEPGETTRRAALREAREEAGVTGEIEEPPCTRYRYELWGSTGGWIEVCVEAYLLAVESQATPGGDERMRMPQWFGPREAIPKLAEDRDPEWSREHRRLIETAVRRLGG